MPRKRLYRTPEEKKAANRDKSRRHYERHKSEIQRNRRNNYKIKTGKRYMVVPNTCAARCGFPSTKRSSSSGEPSEGKGSRGEWNLRYWTQRASRVARKYERLIGDSAFDHVEDVFNNFKQTGDQDIISDAITSASCLQKHIEQCQAQILQLAGVGIEYEQAASVARRISNLISCFEEILCAAMGGTKELFMAHKKRSLMYQNV